MSETAPAPPQASAFRLVGTLGLIAIVSGLLVVSTYQATKPRILANQQAALEKAVLSVLPGAVTREDLTLAAGTVVMGGRDAEGHLVGYALEGAARGYQDVVRILYGFDPARRVVIGMTVLQSTETPGLGDRILRDPAFHANFEALDVSREIEVVKNGAKTQAWQIDGISGATVSSNAVGKALQSGAALRSAIVEQGATP
jgi:electron transport complex protein RnfG